MSRTGWCRECGAWIDVEPDGRCPRGHGAECVDAVHAEAGGFGDGGSAQGFGVGEMPAIAKRFNWGAFFLTPLWGIANGSSAVVSWWLATLFITLGISSMLTPTSSAAAIAIASSVAAVSEIGIRLWVGMNANRWVWQRERMRLTVLEGTQPRFTVGTFLGRQLKWLVAGAVLTVFSVLGLAVLGLATTPEAVQMRTTFGITSTQIVASGVWTLAEVVLAVWLSRQMRREQEPPVTAGDSRGGA